MKQSCETSSIWNLTTSKTRQFCETSSNFELDNMKIEASLRGVLNFRSWQRQKRSCSARPPHFSILTTSKTQQFCETSFKNGKLSAELTASYQCILRFLNLTTSKTQRFCETSSCFKIDNIKNEAILPDFLMFRSWQHQKRKNSARLPSKMESWVQSWRPRTNAFCDFLTPPV